MAAAAPTEAAAEKALAVVQAEWEHTPQLASKDLVAHLRETAGSDGRGGDTAGAVAAGLAQSDITLKQTYTSAYVAHAAIEPRSAVAEWGDDGRLTVWCSTQSPFGVRGTLARTFGIPESCVRVIGLDTGVGFGGKTPRQPATEAARIAKARRRCQCGWPGRVWRRWPG